MTCFAISTSAQIKQQHGENYKRANDYREGFNPRIKIVLCDYTFE